MTAKSHIRTAALFPAEVPPAGGTIDEHVVDSFVAQEDLRIVGFELGTEPEVPDAALNADGAISVLLELTPQGRYQRAGVLGHCWYYMRWTAALLYQSINDKMVIMFPAGTGYDMDEGEVLNLVSRVEAAGIPGVAFSVFHKCIIYYTRR